MDILLGADGQRRLESYFDGIGHVLKHPKCLASFATYAMGILGEGERKSVEPIAARACPDPQHVDALHQRLLYFLNDSPWSDREIRRYAANYALPVLQQKGPILSWILDDTGFPKQGTHSVGVQRQYTGTLGKVTNCQIGVSLTLSTSAFHLPIDFELYLPPSWTDDPQRRREARIPDDVVFHTKPQLALQMLRRAIEDGMPQGMVLGDAAYGNSSLFRKEVRQMGLYYALAIAPQTKVFRLGGPSELEGVAVDVRALGAAWSVTPKLFRRITWREGTQHPLSARFAIRRVLPAHDDGTPPEERKPVWLICEWLDGEQFPSKFYLAYAPSHMSKKELVRRLKERWRTERVYEDLKGELGLDHFEGRRFPGWHHHVSVVLACSAFVVAEQARRFPPLGRWPQDRESLRLAA
jgi:SRSO17 transposase